MGPTRRVSIELIQCTHDLYHQVFDNERTMELSTAFDLKAGHCRATCPLADYPNSQVVVAAREAPTHETTRTRSRFTHQSNAVRFLRSPQGEYQIYLTDGVGGPATAFLEIVGVALPLLGL